MSLFCVSIDMDDVWCYDHIHGLDCDSDRRADVIYSRALPRIIEFFDEFNIKFTLFVVGSSLVNNNDAKASILSLSKKGHEIANHSMNHLYNLTHLGYDEKANEIEACEKVIYEITGLKPKGFRAPGYNMDNDIIKILLSRRYLYDSSVFPCPSYYLLRAAAIGAKLLKGRVSKSLIGNPRMLKAPVLPYRVHNEAFWRKGNQLVEIPVTVVTKAKIPFIGTTFSMAGMLASDVLARFASRLPFTNLELHGIDFIDADGDGLSYLKDYQIDLKKPLAAKLEILRRVITVFLEKKVEPTTLAECSKRLFI